MRIEPLVFCLALSIGTFAIDDELQERTNLFIQQKLIPALKEAEIRNVNFTRLHLCHCSTEVGCNARTTGWVPGIGDSLNETDKHLYDNTCYTDGSCYQNARPSPEISHFGCMDEKSVTDETEFHDTAAKVCSNNSGAGSHPNVWICCDSGNFCANETLIYLPPVSSSYWILLTLLALIGFIVVLAVIIGITRKSWDAKFEWYIRFKSNHQNQAPIHDMENNMNNNNRLQVEEVICDQVQVNTMSTSAGAPLNVYPEGLPPNALKMLMALEETSGSGTGPTTLHKRTIGGKIKLDRKIGAGRFGNVALGRYLGEDVAVKIFKSSDEPAFLKEIEIYETTMLRHPHVLRFIGSDRIDQGFTTELYLITEYHENGSLHDFLENNTVNIDTYYQLMYTAASGLSFLHFASIGGSKSSSKPAMAHRDIKSRNIMVTKDFKCAIGDLGLSLSQPDPDQSPKQPLCQNYKCGTVRYLAPEILSSTMQANVFESYQYADVYSFALVMWETLCRCVDGIIVARDPEEVIPYIEWTERDPTDEQMYDVVCVRKLRPTENPLWKEHPEFFSIMELIRACWSANPTARYTSFNCKRKLQDRLSEIRDGKILIGNNGMREQINPQKRKLGPQQKETEMIQMVPVGPRGTKVHDQDTVESRNGQFSRGRDDSRDPLLG